MNLELSVEFINYLQSSAIACLGWTLWRVQRSVVKLKKERQP